MSIRVAQSPAIKKPGNVASKKPRLDSSNGKAQLEYVVPKHSVGSKVVTTKGTKHISNPTKANGSPTKKRLNGKEHQEVVEISSDDEYIGKLVGKKEVSNIATIAVMDSKCKIHLVWEQLSDTQKTVKELQEKICKYRFEKQIQEQVQGQLWAMGAAALTSVTLTATATMTNLQFCDMLM
ncbi:hypothetical protein RHS01_08992 [Rhizoctonia solani]|uniref:Uncharacterized protein n=1 Tax=Rhizoctonia solani TaxID=456999 RepID=A0A8H7LY84_9AGAM|nr:hypothetical protein RHS01_08992 [Rhizoctonia solani]